ncbi:hypothetical protein DPM19_15685 [Actinomadura craniellae]|uniref:Type IV secretion system protein n=1 Tax=Actinomadura craniellae TaxID=2231787 RepID=A0A365H5S7_9ACTN|nr:type IV secretion system protein [Actinomadura craniellae]RAY14399.1 hypothetical protein DPM19_15685 [Actinomadura craniellae]
MTDRGRLIRRRRAAPIQRTPAEGLSLPGRRRGRARVHRRTRRSALLVLFMALFMLSPVAPAGANPFGGDPCRPADSPAPEAYGSGTDGLIKPPDYPNQKLRTTPPERLTYYDRYGTAGQSWYAVDMGCSDAMAMMGNALANTTFTLVRAIDRTTISVYQAAASESLLGWLKRTVDGVISGIGKTFNAQYWAWVVILGAMWLAWWGLVRRRASKVAEGTIWMVAAMVALIWLVARPGDFTTLGTKVSEATSAAFNAALPQSDTKGTTCIPSPSGRDPVSSTEVDATTRNANGLWVALVCKPWLMGEFGTTDPNAKIVKENADKLLWSQAVDLSETHGGQKVDLGKKADAYKEVTENIKEDYPGVYPVFQGKQWTSRLAVSFGALFAALVAGMLILVIAIALIVVKISFLLLLVAGPIFLGIGIHPGIGRVIAIRWLELLLSMLLKQAALIGVLALLLWSYGLILGETLPWGLQILLIALVTFAAFIYRKPFQHLFSAVGYSAVGSREKSDAQLQKSVTEVRKNTAAVAAAAVPGAAGYRLARWGRGDDAEGTEAGTAVADRRAGAEGATADSAGALAGKSRGGAPVAGSGRARDGAPPLNLPSRSGAGGAKSLGDAAGADAAGGTGVVAVRPGGGPGRGSSGGAEGGSGGGSSGGGSGRGSGKTPAGSGTGVGRPTSWAGGGRAPAGDGDGVSAVGSGRRGRSGGSGGPGGSGGSSGSGGSGGSGGSAGSGGSGGSGRSGRSERRGGAEGGSGGGGRSLFGGRSGGSGGDHSRTPARSSGGSPDPASGVPRPRPGGGSGTDGGARREPPPLWGGREADSAPPIPFWLRPVDRDGDRDA